MSYFVKRKNKQYQIEKGLLLFTQPKSPYFYGKIRHNKKYLTKSFAPITDKQEAIYELYNWRSELLSEKDKSVHPLFDRIDSCNASLRYFRRYRRYERFWWLSRYGSRGIFSFYSGGNAGWWYNVSNVAGRTNNRSGSW